MLSPFRATASPRTVVSAMCALGGAIASVPLASGFPWAQVMLQDHPAGVLVVALLTAALTFATIRATLRTSVPLLVFFGPSAGALVAAVSLVAVFGGTLMTDHGSEASLERSLVLLGFFALFAGSVGAMLGLLFSLFYLLPTAIAARQLKRRTIDGGAYTGVACAVWLGAVSAAALPFAPEVDKWAVGPLGGVVGLIVALIVGAQSVRRMLEFRRFVASVRRGEQRGYRIRPLAPGEDLGELRDALLFSSTPASFRNVEVLEETALDVQPFRGHVPVFRAAALVRAAA